MLAFLHGPEKKFEIHKKQQQMPSLSHLNLQYTIILQDFI